MACWGEEGRRVRCGLYVYLGMYTLPDAGDYKAVFPRRAVILTGRVGTPARLAAIRRSGD